MRAAGALLLGATSFHGARGYWPPLADDPEAPEVGREISRLYNTLDKIVISDSTAPDDTASWQDNTEVVRRDDAHDRIAELRTTEGADLVCFGSLTTCLLASSWPCWSGFAGILSKNCLRRPSPDIPGQVRRK